MKLYEELFDDENYYAVNKPSGVLTIPDRYNLEIPNLLTAARKKYPHLMTTHRIDKDTSGVVVFAKNEKAHAHLNKQFEAHTVEKVYTTLVLGKTPDEGQIDLRITEDPRRPGKMECHKKVGKPVMSRSPPPRRPRSERTVRRDNSASEKQLQTFGIILDEQGSVQTEIIDE
jgi:23S rRNA pseudouridine955/2504/2580 synthase/23S rRNA pseudouridine1911/1915/1917 synthase